MDALGRDADLQMISRSDDIPSLLLTEWQWTQVSVAAGEWADRQVCPKEFGEALQLPLEKTDV